ncbi:MAG TPA: DUF5320 family protein [Prolixibacteraceae bacterium]|jgi:hypothetical protein|nr:DUF5320 family protein [Prolixibacteraceae bacterium]HPB05829.1 DUF5320 family protein [Prolixibacteraceae bacterium]HUM89220.1 DUF5320 family protein [Prolixibacteraceae bacterium]
MPQLNGTGPEMKGEKTGRGMGKCREVGTDEAREKLGTGMGLRRHSGGGQGQGKRLKAGLDKIEKK